MKVTKKDLTATIDRLNRVTNSPETPWKRVDGRNVAQIGNYHLSEAYGGYELCQMMSEGGGVSDTLKSGHVPKKELYNLIHAFLRGIED